MFHDPWWESFLAINEMIFEGVNLTVWRLSRWGVTTRSLLQIPVISLVTSQAIVKWTILLSCSVFNLESSLIYPKIESLRDLSGYLHNIRISTSSIAVVMYRLWVNQRSLDCDMLFHWATKCTYTIKNFTTIQFIF